MGVRRFAWLMVIGSLLAASTAEGSLAPESPAEPGSSLAVPLLPDTLPEEIGDADPPSPLPEESAVLHERLTDLLAAYGELDGLRDVRLRLGRDSLHLAGMALHEEDRARAEELALGLEGVEAVANRIEVVDRTPWDEAGEPAAQDAQEEPATTEPAPADTEPAQDEGDASAGRAFFLSGLVLLGVLVAATVLFVRLRRLREEL